MSLSPAERVRAYPGIPSPERATEDRPESAVIRRRSSVVTRARALAAAGAAVLFLLTLYPRLINLDGYLTTDEGNWMGRTALFTRALRDGDPRGTYQSGHPGVMTMWTALVGMGPERALGLVPYAVVPDALEKAPDYLNSLHRARWPFAVLTSAAVVAVALLTWRLFGAGPGLLAGVLLGLDPFFLAHSVVAHVDSNVTTWMSVCLLAALVYFWGGGAPGRGYLALSGVAAGLAFLSKAPSAFLPLFVPIVALAALARSRRLADGRAWLRLVADGLIWGGLALLAALLLWPSFRADPLGTLQQMISYTEVVGGSDHENFFLNQPIGDPGWRYYPVALALRLTPVTLAGLVLLVVGLLPFGRRAPSGWAARAGLLALFCGLFLVMMATAPKKFDRYLLPIWPALQVLAAVGTWLLLRRLPRGIGGRALPAALVLLGVAQVLPAALVFPYYLAYYNPLFGGGPTARRAIVVGWGEGLDVVTDYLNTKPNADRLTLAGFYPRVMRAQFDGQVVSDKQYDAAVADYIVLYVNAIQRDLADRLRTIARDERPEMVVRINGIEYARLIAVPPPPRRSAAGTEFGGTVRLERMNLRSDERPQPKSDDFNPGDGIDLTLRWRLARPVAEDLVAVVSLVDKQGVEIARHETPVGGADAGTSTMEANDVLIETHRILLPNEQNRYDLLVGLKRPNGEPLPVTAWPERLAQDARRAPDRVVVDNIDAQ